MKKLIIYSFVSLLMISGCKREDNERIPAIAQIPFPQLTKVSGDAIIASQNPDAFKAEFSVGLNDPKGVKPAKYDVVIRKNGDNTKTRVLQAGVTTFPSTISVTGVQLKSLFGEAVALGDEFDMGVDITALDGKKYLAFPTVGIPYSPGTAQSPGSSTTIKYSAVCKFNMADYGVVGTTVPYVIIEDGWADYSAGQTILVKIIDETHMSFTYLTDHPNPIVIEIDPNSNATSVASVSIGDYGGDFYSAKSIPSASNEVTPCQAGVSVSLQFSGPGAPAGGLVISFKKK